MSEELNRQDAIDEAAAHDFLERSVMCAEVTLTGSAARSIARYISNLEVESDNDLADVQASAKELMATSEDLVRQNAEIKTRHADAVRLLRESDEIVQILTRGHEPSEWKESITYRSADLRKRIGALLAKEADK